MNTPWLRCLAGLALGVAAASRADPAAQLYAEHCAACHDDAAQTAPSRKDLASMAPERILAALVGGSMSDVAAMLSPAERRAVSAYAAGKALEEAPVLDPPVAARCRVSGAFTLGEPDWSGWGGGLENRRYRAGTDAGLKAAEVPRLKVKWAFGFPGDVRAHAQPALVGGRLFVGSEGGRVYALDASTGCVHWTRDLGAGVRAAPSVAEVATPMAKRAVVFFGDERGFVHALDAGTGEVVWFHRVDDSALASVTGSPVYFQGRLYVPVASSEEAAAAAPTYPCCRFRGSLVALDAGTGEQVWKTYMVAEPQSTGHNRAGAETFGPSGAAIWSSPAVDPARHAIYVTTGNNYSAPATDTSDAFVALDLDTGSVLWSRQMTAGDVSTAACALPDHTNCPPEPGPDFDFGAGPMIVALPAGGRAVIAGQKSGVVHAVDPDRAGTILWQVRIGRGGRFGGVQWGSAADAGQVYVALSDLGRMPDASGWPARPDPGVGGGLFALQLQDGKRKWYTPPPGCGDRARCSPAQLAAVTAIEGAVFSGSLDGHLRAYAAADGRVIWDYDTQGKYETVNGVPGHGGSLDGAGPVVGGGMLFVGSGDPAGGVMSGNVILAFSVDGK